MPMNIVESLKSHYWRIVADERICEWKYIIIKKEMKPLKVTF